ncbi:MAG: NAD(P)/FAD-dependent oxidoreductase [Deltaproteobacteria bacterium]
MSDQQRYDCIIVGAGPGGLQAAIHLARFNRRVLLLHRPGGRTSHARHIENFLGLKLTTGSDLIETGLAQVEHFGVVVHKQTATRVEKGGDFLVEAGGEVFHSPYVIAASGATENLPRIKNLGRHFAKNFYTCVDCDGYRTIGKKLLLMGNSMNIVRLAFAMQRMFTKDVSILAVDFTISEVDRDLLGEDGIKVYEGVPMAMLGEEELEGVELKEGRTIACEAVMAGFGMRLNDDYLTGLPLKRDGAGFKILTDHNCETSVPGLFAVGTLREGHAQAIIAAGQGAMVAIEINQRLLEL